MFLKSQHLKHTQGSKYTFKFFTTAVRGIFIRKIKNFRSQNDKNQIIGKHIETLNLTKTKVIQL